MVGVPASFVHIFSEVGSSLNEIKSLSVRLHFLYSYAWQIQYLIQGWARNLVSHVTDIYKIDAYVIFKREFIVPNK